MVSKMNITNRAKKLAVAYDRMTSYQYNAVACTYKLKDVILDSVKVSDYNNITEVAWHYTWLENQHKLSMDKLCNLVRAYNY